MAAKISRRSLAALPAVALASSAPSEAQQPAEDDMTIQRENLKKWREQIAKVKLPIAVEPVVTFKV